MATLDISADDLEFIEDTHTYLDAGSPRQSATQMLKSAGLVNYDGIKPDVLEEARRRGVHLHAMTEAHDKREEVDPLWMSEKEWNYFQGYLAFLRDTRVRWSEVERRMVVTLFGCRVGMTFDRLGLWRDGMRALGELKFTAAPSPVWGIQLAIYEMGVTGRSSVGYMHRFAVQVKPNGTYKIHWFNDPADGAMARTVICYNHGLGNMEQHAEVIATWKRNNGITK